MTQTPRALSILIAVLPALQLSFSQSPLPIKDPSTAGYKMRPEVRQFAIGIDQLKPSQTVSADPSGSGLLLDLRDTSLYGRVYSGQAYFDETLTDYPETRFRQNAEIVKGRATISLRSYFNPSARSNANKWTDRGVLGYRLDLLRNRDGKPVHLGLFDSRVHFQRKEDRFVPTVSIIQPPMVGLICSDHPDWILFSFSTDRPAKGAIEVKGAGRFNAEILAERFEIRIDRLKPSRTYEYRAIAVDGPDTAFTPWLKFNTAPPKGEGSVVFAYAGDGRASSGGGEYEYIGVNRKTGEQIAALVHRKGGSFLLFGGDLISGHVNSTEEFAMELMGFRESYAPMLHSIPLYSAIGNHEALLNTFMDSSSRGSFAMDKWPYATESAEALFAQAMLNPQNGPRAPSGFPPYDETVYAFHYGPVKLIVMNNNYWFTYHNRIRTFGGSPEGYFLPGQIEWIREEVRKAETDPKVRYVVLLCQEPFFPAGGHVKDAMWAGGDNNTRAYGLVDGDIRPLGKGLIEVRNELWEIFSSSRKVAAVLGSDEHNFQRMLISQKTPVGLPAKDDRNGNGILDDGVFSPNPAFKYPTWFLISGGAGAPYYTQEEAPWSGSSRFFTPQEHFILFRADAKKIGMEVISHTGQRLDAVEDLMKAKRGEGAE